MPVFFFSICSGLFYVSIYPFCMDLDSSVGMATRYGLHGPGIEFRWGRDFPLAARQAMVPTQFHKMGTGFLSRGKVTGMWR
jgi:hypothetical protein